MKNIGRIIVSTSFLLMLMSVATSAQTTAFNYQGSLRDGAHLANGNYDFEFALFDSLAAGTQPGSTLTRSTVAVVKCANQACTEVTTITTVDDPANFVGAYTSIAIGADRLPVISHYDATAGTLKVAKCGTGSNQ